MSSHVGTDLTLAVPEQGQILSLPSSGAEIIGKCRIHMHTCSNHANRKRPREFEEGAWYLVL